MPAHPERSGPDAIRAFVHEMQDIFNMVDTHKLKAGGKLVT